MNKAELQKRLSALESAISGSTKGDLSESHPRVIAFRKKAMSQLAAKIEEAKTGVPEWERLDETGRVHYWRQKVAKAKYAIANGGATKDDDLAAFGMSPVTHRIMNQLRLEIAQEELPELLSNLAAATKGAKSR